MILLLLFVLGLNCESSSRNLIEEFVNKPSKNGGETWAVLISGGGQHESGWGQYWDDAGILRTYHNLKAAGIDDDHIIVWIYDRCVNEKENPYPGKIYMVPPSEGGIDYYAGVPKDLTGTDINPENFNKLLSGEDMTGIGSGKSLKSGENDRVLLHFLGLGTTNMIAFPMTVLFWADDLHDTLENMHGLNLYGEMLFILDSAKSGSLIHEHYEDDDFNIYFITSTDPENTSYLCDGQGFLIGTTPHTCFNLFFMEGFEGALENKTMETETVEQLYEYVRNNMYQPDIHDWRTKQQVCYYGHTGIGNDTLINWLGPGGGSLSTRRKKLTRESKNGAEGIMNNKHEVSGVYLSDFHRLQAQHASSPTPQTELQLQTYIEYMQRVDRKWLAFVEGLGIPLKVKNSNEDVYDCWPKSKSDLQQGSVGNSVECVRDSVEGIEGVCGSMQLYEWDYYGYLAKACRMGVGVENMVEFMRTLC